MLYEVITIPEGQAPGGAGDRPAHQRGAAAHPDHPVITSYSIHYTKLYEPRARGVHDGLDPLHARLAHVGQGLVDDEDGVVHHHAHQDDEIELLKFGLKWLKWLLFKEGDFKLKPGVVEK